MRTCRYCHHTQCNRCRELETRKGAGYCCRCTRTGFSSKHQAVIRT